MVVVNTREIAHAAAVLHAGGLVVFPTETVYGLGAHALDPESVAGIFAAKGRPRFNPLIVHVASVEQARPLAYFHAEADALAQRFWPGPLTLLLPRRTHIPDLVTAGSTLVGLRVPAHPVAHALLSTFGAPVAAPSANRFMSPSPTTVQHARDQLADAVHCYLDGGPAAVGLESTIIGWDDTGKPVVYRHGGIAVEEIAQTLGRSVAPARTEKILAPGMLRRHYAPSIAFALESHVAVGTEPMDTALLCLRASPSDARHYACIVELAPTTGELTEAASRLFATLHDLSSLSVARVYARRVPEVGLGAAINDRLRRAAAQPNT